MAIVDPAARELGPDRPRILPLGHPDQARYFSPEKIRLYIDYMGREGRKAAREAFGFDLDGTRLRQ